MLPQFFLAQSLAGRLIAATTLMAFLLGSSGFPIWQANNGKDLSVPFPCMHRSCGCRNAEQCWKSCCCFNNRQKLAWAKQRKVQLPEYVAVAAALEIEESESDSSGCCQSSEAKSCCAKPVQKTNSKLQAKGIELNAFPQLEAACCLGALEQWMSLGAIDVTHPHFWQLECSCCGGLPIESEQFDSILLSPPAPPPWC